MAAKTEDGSLNCEPCDNVGRKRKATFIYEMFTARAEIPLCDEHADIARGWSGSLRPYGAGPAPPSKP